MLLNVIKNMHTYTFFLFFFNEKKDKKMNVAFYGGWGHKIHNNYTLVFHYEHRDVKKKTKQIENIK